MITEILIYLSDLFTERNRQKQLTGKSTQLHTVTPSWRASPPCSPLGQETQMRQSTPPSTRWKTPPQVQRSPLRIFPPRSGTRQKWDTLLSLGARQSGRFSLGNSLLCLWIATLIVKMGMNFKSIHWNSKCLGEMNAYDI